MSEYHVPVMLEKCVEGLAIKPEGTYLDLTFGGGGHSRAILSQLQGGHLYGFDQDADAVANAADWDTRSFTFVEANFRHVKRYLKLHGVKQVDGVLADLGISSHQIDNASRGFSTRFDADLDMRMDQQQDLTARDVVNNYSEGALHKILGLYGEVKNAKTLAAALVSSRINKPIHTVADLKEVLDKLAPRGKEFKYYAQVFQAFRIEVNQEMKALEEMLVQMQDIIKPGGRLVVLTYHSLEDRLVKNYISKGKLTGEVEKDFYGNEIKPFKAVNRKPLLPSAEELVRNNRARSAKLRIAERLG